MPVDDPATAAVAIGDLLNHDIDLVDQVEGLLLGTGGRDETITPVSVTHETSLGREAAGNLFRQLEVADAVNRITYSGHVAESTYAIETSVVRDLFSATRQAIDIIRAYRTRQPPATEAEPLITFPDDPTFAEATPAGFGMEQLLSAIAREVKAATDSIILVAPFFEGTGFERLREVLADALERGVELTIITRYLSDSDSYNRTVLTEFTQYLDDERGVADQVKTVDYTVWDARVPESERRQDGAKPAFTLHAKVMLFDETAAYIGSANITDYGFDRYLELGVLLRGPPVRGYHTFCQSLLDSDGATEVKL